MIGALVLFDMDGLLLNTERVCLTAFNKTAVGFGLPEMTDVFMAMIGLRDKESRPIIENGLAGRVGHDAFCSVWDREIERVLDINVPVIDGVLTFLETLNHAMHGWLWRPQPLQTRRLIASIGQLCDRAVRRCKCPI